VLIGYFYLEEARLHPPPLLFLETDDFAHERYVKCVAQTLVQEEPRHPVSVTRIGSFTPNIDGATTPASADDHDHGPRPPRHTQIPHNIKVSTIGRRAAVTIRESSESPSRNLRSKQQQDVKDQRAVAAIWSLMTPGFTVFLAVYCLLQLQSVSINVLCVSLPFVPLSLTLILTPPVYRLSDTKNHKKAASASPSKKPASRSQSAD
jgi:hypothetical protein